jgi:hypothetical protein
MKKIITAIRRAIIAAREPPIVQDPIPEPQGFQVAGRIIKCSQCGGQTFIRFELEPVLGNVVLCEHGGLQCSRCSHLEFFAQRPEEAEDGE